MCILLVGCFHKGMREHSRRSRRMTEVGRKRERVDVGNEKVGGMYKSISRGLYSVYEI